MPKKVGIAVVLCSLITAMIVGGCGIMKLEVPEPKKLEYPTRAIKVIVPFAPGGGVDLQARAFERVAVKYLGQAWVVDNKVGAGGSVGFNTLASSEPDGYTLGVAPVDLILQTIIGGSVFHYATALDPLAQFSTAPVVLVVNAEAPWKTLDDLIAYAKQHPSEIKAGHGGIGSVPHIVNATFAVRSGIEMIHVPFNGSSETTAALLGNHIQVTSASPNAFREQIRAGKLRVLATTGEKRMKDPIFANVPTFKEQGIDLVFNNWYTIVSPKPLSPELRVLLQSSLKKMIEDPEFTEIIEKMGLEAEYLDSDATLDRWVVDMRRLSKMVKETGILEQVRKDKGLIK